MSATANSPFFCIFVKSKNRKMNQTPIVEQHPFKPFVPRLPKVLMLGTFPPKPSRWSMEFYYPNKINDMWRIMGSVFFGDKNRFWDDDSKSFRLSDIKDFLETQGIALYDTAVKARRLKDNASDKFLDIVETIDLDKFFSDYPTIKAVVTTGEKASSVVAETAGCRVPAIGSPVACELHGHQFMFCRMPSSSRAYPLAFDKKTEAYRNLFLALGYSL